MKLLILNGVNLNLTGKREQDVYGGDCVQSNSEGELCSQIHGAEGQYDGIVLNAGAYTHYSLALRDAIAAVKVPVVEVHMSNVHAREEFRKKSVLTEVCKGEILGFGKNSYLLAMESFRL